MRQLLPQSIVGLEHGDQALPDAFDDLLVGFIGAEDLEEHFGQVLAELAVLGGREVVAEVGLVVELAV